MKKVVVGIAGSSGSIYAKLLLEKLVEVLPPQNIMVIISDNGITNWELECGKLDKSKFPFIWLDKKDFFSAPASGSSLIDAMVICPCSMGLVGRIASGVSDDLMTRAADVMLKERRRLIIVPRETPLNLIHLENLTKLTKAGAIICPASPSFYSKPSSIEELCMTVVSRILDLLEIQNNGFRWG